MLNQEEFNKITELFNDLVDIDRKYMLTQDKEDLAQSINIACELQNRMHKADLTYPQLIKMLGYDNDK